MTRPKNSPSGARCGPGIRPPYQYALSERFPPYFAVLALSIGGASYVNARLVMRYGMRPLFGWAIKVLSAISLAFLAVASAADDHPPLGR